MADLSITNLLVVDPVTKQLSPFASQITITSDARTGNASSEMDNVIGTGIGPGNGSDTKLDGTAASVDVNFRCAGPSCGGINGIYGGSAENNLSTHHMTNVGNFALGDMSNTGNALAPGGAQGLTRADASIDNGATKGSANATIHNAVTVNTLLFTETDVNLQLALTYDAFVRAFVDPLLPAGTNGFASGGISWSLSLRDVTACTPLPGCRTATLLWSPDELNQGLASNNAGQNDFYSSAGTIYSEERVLIAGHTYNLVIEQASNSTVIQQAVPEPGSLLLLGAGLLGLGMARRRKQG